MSRTPGAAHIRKDRERSSYRCNNCVNRCPPAALGALPTVGAHSPDTLESNHNKPAAPPYASGDRVLTVPGDRNVYPHRHHEAPCAWPCGAKACSLNDQHSKGPTSFNPMKMRHGSPSSIYKTALEVLASFTSARSLPLGSFMSSWGLPLSTSSPAASTRTVSYTHLTLPTKRIV